VIGRDLKIGPNVCVANGYKKRHYVRLSSGRGGSRVAATSYRMNLRHECIDDEYTVGYRDYRPIIENTSTTRQTPGWLPTAIVLSIK